jgi:colanic acid biosynthesis glycosyl transferase WcaI
MGRVARHGGTRDVMKPERKPKLLVVSQVYAPDPAAVGQYVTDAAEEMVARGWDVQVLSAGRGYDDPSVRYPAVEVRGGVRVRRLPLSSFGKRSIAVRLLAQGLFVAQAFVWGLCARGVSAILVSTSPPFAGFLGALLSVVKRRPMVWWVMDLNPDQMIAAGRIGPSSLAARTFDWLNRVAIRRARWIVVLDRYMGDRVIAKLPHDARVAGKVRVIPPWSLDNHVGDASPGPNAFRVRHGLENRFVVMYSGNHSEQNPLDTLLDAAERVRDLESMVFVFVGGGTGKAAVERRIAAGAINIVSLPYEPMASLGTSLAAADVHVVSVGDTMVGIVHPCKIYTAMAVARPILLLGPSPCHATDIMAAGDVGWHVRHGDVAAAETALRDAWSRRADDLPGMGLRSAAIVAERYSRSRLVDDFAGLLDESGRECP